MRDIGPSRRNGGGFPGGRLRSLRRLGQVDRDGYLWLLDRKKDMVVRGGQDIYCIEVESKLYLHPSVLRAAVVSVPDHVFSERVKAIANE